MFRKYNSIENTYREEFLEKVRHLVPADERFVVQEKVHGANLSFYTSDGVQFAVAKRSGPVEKGENFYQAPEVRDRLLPQLVQLWELIAANRPDLQQLHVFGELCGGSYPHPEVKRDPTAPRLQKGIHYSPRLEFYGFDLLVNGTEYLPVPTIAELFERTGMLYAKTLLTGTLEECLAYSNCFPTLLPRDLGLPELPDNTCEGVVIRPEHPCFFKSGARVLLKNKNDRWSERSKTPRRERKPVEVPEQVASLQHELLGYLTENRLSNVLSKIGEVTLRDFGRVIGLFTADAWEDFEKDFGGELNVLEKAELKMVRASMGKQAVPLVRQRLMR